MYKSSMLLLFLALQETKIWLRPHMRVIVYASVF